MKNHREYKISVKHRRQNLRSIEQIQGKPRDFLNN